VRAAPFAGGMSAAGRSRYAWRELGRRQLTPTGHRRKWLAAPRQTRQADAVKCWGAVMFGMLDYRAHKLYALLHFPFGFFIWIITIIILPLAVYFITIVSIQTTIPNRMAQLLLSLVALEIASICWFFIAKLIGLIPTVVFNFFIDPLPADGRTRDQAQAVVQGGQRAIWFLQLNEPAARWSDEMIDQVSRIGFLQQVFYRGRVRNRLLRLRHHYRSHPALPQTEYNSNNFLKQSHLSIDAIEHIVCNPFWRNAVLRYCVILSVWLFVPRV
jgi:hypothetical protein